LPGGTAQPPDIVQRASRRSFGFAVAAISTLALGMGAATAVFSVVNGVLLTPLSYPEPDRIVRVFQIDGTGHRMGNVSEPYFLDWQALRHSFEAMAQIQSGPLPVAVDGEVAMTSTAAVSREFFDVFGVGPAIGRGFSPDELQAPARRQEAARPSGSDGRSPSHRSRSRSRC
jgi:hypothetical protein